ncbi:haloacid dehalogenase type II [Gemmobacter caeruleus]|uniref:haloacid dehalogenase type II n=1 Tax=Gemmobacter caeruleus TaxID=2595004 RepID=UPI0011ECCEA0|nr:haloacid dehalogenase type II [Gemmobacter caeruleus]
MPIKTVIFDAYGTLFDVDAAAREAARSHPVLAECWPRLSADWRRKQLEYSWLRSLMGLHAGFDSVTADALDWALDAQGLADVALRRRLLDLYQALPAYPEVPAVLETLAARRVPAAILTNGTPGMVARAVAAAGLESRFATLLSVESVGIFKPAPRVYDLVLERFAVEPAAVLFVSSNGWDIAGAGAFGFRTLWVNRAGLPVDRLPHRPARIAPDLTTLMDDLA